MKRKRSVFVGMTDYSGFSLEEILEHLNEWKHNSQSTVNALKAYADRVIDEEAKFDEPREIQQFILVMCDFLERAVVDLDRLATEIPRGVRSAHVELVNQLVQQAKRADRDCVDFKRQFIARSLKDPDTRGILDGIYADSRDAALYMFDLGNLSHRLKTFVDVSLDKSGEDEVFDLKPNLYGVGVNLKVLWRKVRLFVTRLWGHDQ